MSKLTTAERDRLPSSAFADPAHRKFPIMDEGHREAAMGRIAQHRSGSTAEHLRDRVRQRDRGHIGQGKGPVS